MYSVYVHQNKTNGKRYVGITSSDVRTRWRNGYGYQEHLPIGRAFRKYGWNGFTHEILHTGLTEEQAKQIEIDLIKKYDTRSPEYGYNICAGGDGVTGWHPSEETRMKISESAKKRIGELNPNFGHKWTDEMKENFAKQRTKDKLSTETLQKMSEAAKKRTGEKNPFYGKCHSAETKKKISEARSRPVDMFDKDMSLLLHFNSIREAAEQTGINKVAISNCCRGVTKSSGGYIWHYTQ